MALTPVTSRGTQSLLGERGYSVLKAALLGAAVCLRIVHGVHKAYGGLGHRVDVVSASQEEKSAHRVGEKRVTVVIVGNMKNVLLYMECLII